MPKSSLNISLKGADDIFSTEESRQEEKREQVQQIPIAELFPFKNHPFKVLDDETMQRTVESIQQIGVTNPLIARPRPEGGYEIISGHRRQHAAQLAGLDTLPVIVRQMDDDAAILLMVDSNLQRESILPSERAFAYKMKLEALKNQGARSDLTSAQVGQKLWSVEQIASDAGESKTQIQRFIRLTNLIPEMLDLVDQKKISFNPAVELSYLDEAQQRDFLEAINDTQNFPSLSQAQRLKKLAQEGHFSYDVAFAVMGEPKKDELDKVVMAEIAVLKTHIVNYARTRPVYDAYRKAGYSKRFLEAHREEITLHKAAKAAFDEAGLKKLPKVKALNAEYSELLTQKKAAYPDYRKAREEMQELVKAQKNIELFFAEEKDAQEKQQSR